MPQSLIEFMAYISTTPGHAILFLAMIVSFFIIRFVFKRPIRRFIEYKLYKKRRETVYRFLFFRLKNIIKPIRYLISLYILEESIYIFTNDSSVEFLFYFLFTVMIAWWVYEMIKFSLYASLSIRLEKQKRVRRELFNLFLNIALIMISIVVILIMLSKMGADLTGLITSLGIGGALIGLSAKDTLTNFFDSIRLVGENAFNLGDWIETKDIAGFVTEIGLAATRIRTFDNALVTIPNSKLAGDYIKNWSKRIIGRRIKFELKLKYTYDTREIDKVLFEIREMIEQHPDIVNDNKLKYLVQMKQTLKDGLFDAKDTLGVRSTLLVYLDNIDTYSMNILVYAFSLSVNWEEWLQVKQDVIKNIIHIIDESDLELAIPSKDIMLQNVDME